MQSSPHRYTRTAVVLHWLMALGLLGAIAVGFYMDSLPLGLARLKLINWHKWFGISLLLLVLIRLGWRSGHRPPPDLPMPRWQTQAAHAMHWALYGLMLLVPLLGWAYSNAAGFPVVWFGLLPLPDFVGKNKELAEVLKSLHHVAAWTLLALILAHAAAALKHQFIDRDRLIDRMKL